MSKKISINKHRIADETVCILLVRGDNLRGEKSFAYIAVSAARLPEFINAQNNDTFYSEDFGVVIESGKGEPSYQTKLKMQREYLFNHGPMIDIPDADKAIEIVKNLPNIRYSDQSLSSSRMKQRRDSGLL